MRTAIRLALALYPRWWRSRYGSEMEALLEESGAGWAALFDVVRGALAVRATDIGGSMRRVSTTSLVLIPTLVGAVVMFTVAMGIAPRYEASALVEIVAPATPTFQRKAEDRLESIAITVMTSARLEQIIKDLDLYHRERAQSIPMAQLTDEMREDIELFPVGPAGFRVTYMSADPKVAQRVTERLAGLFIDESTRAESLEVVRLRERAEAPLRRLTEIETAVMEARQRPDSGVDLLALNREYRTVSAGYQALLDEIEKALKAPRKHFTLRDAPTLPTTPFGPNRLFVTTLGAGLGLAIGLLLVAGRAIGRSAGMWMQRPLLRS